MGVVFRFYAIDTGKKEEYDSMIKSGTDDCDLWDWLEQNTLIKEADLHISGCSSVDLTGWLDEHSKNAYHPDMDIFYEIDKTGQAKESFHRLYWIKEKWLDPRDIWRDQTFLIVLKQY